MIFRRGHKQVNRSADSLYMEARARWSKVVNLNIYDNEDMLRSVVRLLEKARRQNANHVPSLVLLSDLLMQLNADGEAMQVVESLLALEPGNQTHVRKKDLIQQLHTDRSDSNRHAVREYVEARWTGTSDW